MKHEGIKNHFFVINDTKSLLWLQKKRKCNMTKNIFCICPNDKKITNTKFGWMRCTFFQISISYHNNKG